MYPLLSISMSNIIAQSTLYMLRIATIYVYGNIQVMQACSYYAFELSIYY